MDQLGVTWPLFISQLVNFLILIFILRAVLYEPVLKMLAQRKDRIAEGMREAERVAVAAQQAEADKAKVLDSARREAAEIRSQAARDAEKIAQEIRSRAEQEATDIRMKAQEDAQKQVAIAMTDANKQIAELAILATEQLLGRELAKKDEQARFVTEFLARAKRERCVMDSKQEQAQRYAQAVYQAMLEQWQSALKHVEDALSKDPALHATLMDGSKEFKVREKAMEAALPKGLPHEIKNLLKLMLQDGNLDLLSDVSASLGRVASGQQAPVKAEITSAVELSEKEKEALRQSLTKQFSGDLSFAFSVDPSLMGGLRVRVGDRLIDTSVASRLTALRESLTSAVR